MASLLQSLSSLQHYDDHLLEAAEAAAITHLPTMNSNNLASIAAAFGKLKYDAPLYFAAVAQQVGSRSFEGCQAARGGRTGQLLLNVL